MSAACTSWIIVLCSEREETADRLPSTAIMHSSFFDFFVVVILLLMGVGNNFNSCNCQLVIKSLKFIHVLINGSLY